LSCGRAYHPRAFRHLWDSRPVPSVRPNDSQQTASEPLLPITNVEEPEMVKFYRSAMASNVSSWDHHSGLHALRLPCMGLSSCPLAPASRGSSLFQLASPFPGARPKTGDKNAKTRQNATNRAKPADLLPGRPMESPWIDALRQFMQGHVSSDACEITSRFQLMP